MTSNDLGTAEMEKLHGKSQKMVESGLPRHERRTDKRPWRPQLILTLE